MRFANTAAGLFFTIAIASGATASAQCQGRGQSTGNTATASAPPYTQSSLATGYNQSGLGPLAYNQQFLSPTTQTFEYKQAMLAMQVQSRSLALRNQVAQAQATAKQMKKDSAAMRKAAQQERAENLALREERESAKRMKNYESQRSANRLASVQ